MGENPITKTIKLKIEEDDSSYLELKADCTALYISEKEEPKEILSEYKYSYDAAAKKIYMIVEKDAYYNDWNNEEEWYQLLSYNEIRSKINKDFTTEKIRQLLKDMYEREKDDEYYKDDYANYNSYEDYENELVKQAGVGSFDAYVKYVKLKYENGYKATFGAQVTYLYEIKGGKMMLTEKFTGVKNMIDSDCYFSFQSGYAYISCTHAKIVKNDDRYYGTIDTDKKTILFESGEDRSTYESTYTEDFAEGTVTINFNGKPYVCNFEGVKYTQVEVE